MNSQKARKNVICQFLSILIQSGVRGQLLFVNFTIDFCKLVTPPRSFLTIGAFVYKKEHICEFFQVSQICPFFS